jgi:hypothetical protein
MTRSYKGFRLLWFAGSRFQGFKRAHHSGLRIQGLRFRDFKNKGHELRVQGTGFQVYKI